MCVGYPREILRYTCDTSSPTRCMSLLGREAVASCQPWHPHPRPLHSLPGGLVFDVLDRNLLKVGTHGLTCLSE